MKLTDGFVVSLIKRNPDGGFREGVATVAEADGVLFACPVCTAANHPHAVICWFSGRGVPDTESPGPGRWSASGTTIADLTLSPSVHLKGAPCGWHGWVKNGDAA